MQIFTKKGDFGTQSPQLEAKVSAGLIESRWENTVQQDHSLALSGGGQEFAYHLGGGYLHHGDWAPPSTAATDASLYGGMRGSQGPLMAELSARYYSKSVGRPQLNPDWASIGPSLAPYDQTDALEQQTYGLTLRYSATPRWQHNLVLGYDHLAYDYYLNRPRFTTPADSFLLVSNTERGKASVAYNSTYTTPLGRAVESSLTAGMDHWTYREGSFYNGRTTSTTGQLPPPDFASRDQYNNAGYFAQVQLGFWDALFLTAGLRAEDNPNFGRDFGLAWAPRVGASYVGTVGDVTAKARVAYGKAIRPPSPRAAQTIATSSTSYQFGNPNLGPERRRAGTRGSSSTSGGGDRSKSHTTTRWRSISLNPCYSA